MQVLGARMSTQVKQMDLACQKILKIPQLYTRSIRSLLVDLVSHEASCLERTIHCPAPNGCDEVVQLKVATIWLDDCGRNIGFEKFTFPF